MGPTATNPKIEELRFRLKTDPKSRLFFPLAEELRKVGGLAEAEQVLRTGLGNHPTYLSAWVSLGRVLRDAGKNPEAVESLNKALQIDPGNVVAARILADSYLALGEKVEAIKKYKLVHALMPSDEELEAVIARLELEINPPAPAPFVDPVAAVEPTIEQKLEEEAATGDDEPMAAAHTESPFEEPASAYGAEAFAVEAPQGMHIDPAPLEAEVPTPVAEEESPFADEGSSSRPFAPRERGEGARSADEGSSPFEEETEAPHPAFGHPLPADAGRGVSEQDESDVFEPSTAAPPDEDFTETVTMADLYARQGLTEDARNIYEHILQRDPANLSVRAKLQSLSGAAAAPAAEREPEPEPAPPKAAKIERLERWLSKVSRV